MGRIKVLKNGQYIDIQPKVLKNGQYVKATGYMLKNGQWIKITEEQFDETFNCTWTSSYNASGSIRDDAKSRHIYQGNYTGANPSSTRGNMSGLIGFDYSTISSKLKGATIQSIEVELHALHWYWGTGGTLNIGTHNKATKPSTYKPSTDAECKVGLKQQSFARKQKKWVSLPISVAENIRDGKAKGLLFWINSNNMLYYGYFAGISDVDGSPPRLRIRYTK